MSGIGNSISPVIGNVAATSAMGATGPTFDPGTLTPLLWGKHNPSCLDKDSMNKVSELFAVSPATQGLSQLTSTRQPLLQSGVANNNPGALYDGADDRMSSPSLGLSADFSIYVAVKVPSISDMNQMNINTTNGLRWYYQASGATWKVRWKETGGLFQTITIGSSLVPGVLIHEFKYDSTQPAGGEFISKTNGAARVVTGGVNGIFGYGGAFTFGTGFTFGDFGGHLLEVIIYNSLISDANGDNIINDYLNAKYKGF